jgi:hypothetical protein
MAINLNMYGIPISEEQCMGDSLTYINNAFISLSGGIQSLYDSVLETFISKSDVSGAYLLITGGTLLGDLQIGPTNAGSLGSGSKILFGRSVATTDATNASTLPTIRCGSTDGKGNDLFISGNSVNSKIVFGSGPGGAERMRITNTGYVGINTSAPETTLVVNGITTIKADDNGIVLFACKNGQNVTGSIYDRVDAVFDTASQLFTIGTSHAGVPAGRSLAFKTGNTERVRILAANGYVGLGTTAPSVRLDVVGDIKATGDVIAFSTSDSRLKQDLTPISGALDKVSQLNGYTFTWNNELQQARTGKSVGVIAQEVERILPELVVDRENGFKAVDYEGLVPVLIEAIKELKTELETLKASKLG